MTRRQEKYRRAIERRVARLVQRVADPSYQGDPGRQWGELAALRWALLVIDGAAAHDLLGDLENEGERTTNVSQH